MAPSLGITYVCTRQPVSECTSPQLQLYVTEKALQAAKKASSQIIKLQYQKKTRMCNLYIRNRHRNTKMRKYFSCNWIIVSILWNFGLGSPHTTINLGDHNEIQTYLFFFNNNIYNIDMRSCFQEIFPRSITVLNF